MNSTNRYLHPLTTRLLSRPSKTSSMHIFTPPAPFTPKVSPGKSRDKQADRTGAEPPFSFIPRRMKLISVTHPTIQDITHPFRRNSSEISFKLKREAAPVKYAALSFGISRGKQRSQSFFRFFPDRGGRSGKAPNFG